MSENSVFACIFIVLATVVSVMGVQKCQVNDRRMDAIERCIEHTQDIKECNREFK